MKAKTWDRSLPQREICKSSSAFGGSFPPLIRAGTYIQKTKGKIRQIWNIQKNCSAPFKRKKGEYLPSKSKVWLC